MDKFKSTIKTGSLVFCFCSIFILGCSTPRNRKTASVRDVGLVGTNGDARHFKMDGDTVVVTVCEPNTVFGETPVDARANCKGKEIHVQKKYFEYAIRALVTIDRAKRLAPITEAEVKTYRNGKLTEEQVALKQAELDQIEKAIEANGEENANVIRRDELSKELSSKNAKAIKNISSELKRVMKSIEDGESWTLLKGDTDVDTFAHTVLSEFDPSGKYPCGEKGSVEVRTKECAFTANAKIEEWELVTRTADLKEVWKELNSGLIWGDRLAGPMSEYAAEKACDGTASENGSLGLSFRLPTAEEFKRAEKNQIRKVLPNITNWYWSSTPYPTLSRVAYVYAGTGGRMFSASRDNATYYVRCVADSK